MGNTKEKKNEEEGEKVLTHTIVTAPFESINISDFKGEFRLIKQGQNER